MRTYAVKHNDDSVIASSRSGGVFTAISDEFLDNGVVYGCVLDEEFMAVHIRGENKFERDKMRGSKYVQSRMNDCFKEIRADLQNGKKVLFSGTSCQVAGLKGFLQKEYDNLLCVDIVCHGVPSPKVWKRYLEWISKGKKIDNVDFRNKNKYGWRDHIETVVVEGEAINGKVWTNLFYSGAILRPSCYECLFKSTAHPGDITIADYWNIENAAPEFDDNKGVSLVLVNTDKGSEYFEKIKKDVVWKETKIEDSMQRAFIRSEYRPENRDEFWEDFENKKFSFIAQKYGGVISFRKKFIKRIKMLFKRILRKDKKYGK